MSIILVETHQKLMRKVRKRAFIIHGILVLMLLASVLFPWISKIENDLIRASYGVVRMKVNEMDAKIRILQMLRSKALTVGQGLDIADVLLSQTDIPMSMILAIMDVESGFNPNAVSEKGARGLLQAMPLTAKNYAGPLSNNIHDPIVNIRACVQYLIDLKRDYGGDWPKILRAYNGGPPNANNKMLDGYVRAVMLKSREYGNDKAM